MNYFDPKTVRSIMPHTLEEISSKLEEGRWFLGSDWKEQHEENLRRESAEGTPVHSLPSEFMARAIAYGEKKYPGRRRETGIFSAMVAGFTTGLWGGFGQDQDPLYGKAEDAVHAFAGGIPASIHDPDVTVGLEAPWNDKGANPTGGILTKQEFTQAAIRLLEGICYKEGSKKPIEEAIQELDRAVTSMPYDPGNNKATNFVQRTKKVLQMLA